MDSGLTQQQLIQEIFFAHHQKRMREVKEKKSRFVHYTSADVAVSIISRGYVWMRNSQTMNDYMEFEHGFRCVKAAYNSEPGHALQRNLEAIFPGFVAEFERRFTFWEPHLRGNTYLTCISEHRPSEDRHGRLSMWRAYGGANGVALVMNNRPFVSETTALNAYTSPVAYLDDKRFAGEFQKVVQRIQRASSLIQALGKEKVLDLLFHVFRFAALCTKHPGFHEEKEWRVIYCPDLEPSSRLVEEVQSVRGVPQKIYKIPLADVPEEGLIGANIPDLLERIIIGPTQYPQAMYQAFYKLLLEAGISDPEKRIFVSDIPLRQ